jgi:hypothetical protein
VARPIVFWVRCRNRQTTPQITLWPVPDNATTYRLYVRHVRQPQDGSTAGGLNVEIPYRFDDAFTVGLAARLAKYYRPELRALLKQDAMEAYGTAARRLGVPIMISPGLQSYFR